MNLNNQIKRLSDKTRKLAERAISGEFGKSMRNASFILKENHLSPDIKYGNAIKLIAEKAPLRIIPEEKIIGAATLFEATLHQVPLTEYSSISHTTIGFEKALKCGYRQYRKQINKRLKGADITDEKKELLSSMLMCLDAAEIWHKRHIDFLKKLMEESSGEEKENYQNILNSLANVPENPPSNFREAIQSLWFMYAFQRLCGNWPGIGRIDKMLGPYLEKDLADGLINLDEARELIAHFWIKGCEWIGCNNYHVGVGGDAQFYQNIILSGIDSEGNDVTNPVTYLVLDVVEELHISDFPIAVRINSNTPEELYRKIAEVQRKGGGIVAIYNEELIIRSLIKFGFPEKDARNFTNDGCWEIIIGGKSAFSYHPFDTLKILQDTMGLNSDEEMNEFSTFENFYKAFIDNLSSNISEINKIIDNEFQDRRPCSLISIFVEGCIEKAKAYTDLGAEYSIKAIHAGGLPDTANSLYALEKLVFDEKEISYESLIKILKNNWHGNEDLRKKILKKLYLYGNDNPEADNILKRVYDDFIKLVGKVKERNGILRPAGISTFGREIEYSKYRKATPFGRFAGEYLATNFAPTPGSDKNGPTALIKSFCKMDFKKLTNGCPLELKILPDSVKGEAGIEALTSLMRSFIALGGIFLHIDVVDSELLKDAKENPDKYPNLSVRISGWSARFATLSEEWQDMLIKRTQQII